MRYRTKQQYRDNQPKAIAIAAAKSKTDEMALLMAALMGLCGLLLYTGLAG